MCLEILLRYDFLHKTGIKDLRKIKQCSKLFGHFKKFLEIQCYLKIIHLSKYFTTKNFKMKFPISICYVATNIAQQSQKSISTYGQPRRMTELKIPVNLSCGIEVCTEIHDETNETLVDAMKRCFKKLPAHRVLIVALAEEISCDLILAVEEARGQRRPLVVDRKSKANSFNSNQITQIREYDCFVQKWLVDLEKTQDLIASSCVIAGFEWPSVLMITNVNHPSQFYACNMVMRAMSRLVWLKTNSIDEVNELGMPFPRTSLFPGFRGGGAFDSPGFRGGGVFDFDLENFTTPKVSGDPLNK